ncbi:MAG: ethanolamine utilization microcompartment protein EutL [Oscillospiraceae bacterium]|nr:ethanolamine utilization microcompartment protein EutL [Oscillospiraceae bacterium]
MKNDALKTNVLAVKIIPAVSASLAEKWNLPKGHRSVGFLTTDCDDVGYVAVDEATKKADVTVVLAKSFYAGAGNATQKYSGEFIGMLSGPNPAEVRSGLNAAIELIENDAFFYSANEDDSVAYFAHCISRTGSYLSAAAEIPEGEAIGYLIAPPLEATYALDIALKSADVKLVAYFEPPSETNFSGGYVTGSQSACKAACEAFGDAVVFCVENAMKY